MKFIHIYFLLAFIFYCCDTPPKTTDQDIISHYDNFKLTYMCVGLGSQFGGMQPTLKITGRKYNYTFEQNSFYGDSPKQPLHYSVGEIRATSIDSIIDIIKQLKDKEIYKTNIHIYSGFIINLLVKYNDFETNFKLHNASDSTAQKIIDILNSNFSADIEKLYLFGS